MRFGISRSPPLVNRGRFSFGLNACDSSDDDSPPEYEEPVSPSDSPFYDLKHEIPPKPLFTNRLKLSIQEQREIEDTLDSVRRKTGFEDPFNKWTKETRTAAFHSATKRYGSNPASMAATKRREAELWQQTSKEAYERQLQRVTADLADINLRVKQHEAKLIADYEQRERLLWKRVDDVIKVEEEKLRRRLEEEEKARRDEEERRRKEEERRKTEEELRKKEERLKAEREEALRKRREQEAAEAKRREQEEIKLAEARKHYGYSTIKEDWEDARKYLDLVKRKHVPAVKDNDALRPIFGKTRRSIIPKIGQLTNSQSEIERITTDILNIVHIQPPHPEPLYFAILSALSKAILMQAETEVSARAVTAIPLAKVTIRLLANVSQFAEVLFARMVQRTGGWAVPIPIPKPQGMSEVEYMKLRGFRTERESQKDFDLRVVGIMTLYFAILTDDVTTPMPPAWSFPRYWTYLARLMSTPVLLKSDMAMQIVAVALEVGGTRAKKAWNTQFIKILALLYKAIQETDAPRSDDQVPNPRRVGAEGLEGKASRVKAMLEIEKVMAAT